MESFKLYVDANAHADANVDTMRFIDFDTIEAYTANVQNKKRIFADEVLNL
jgi:hypothetical protein